jgi:hypothetical protein
LASASAASSYRHAASAVVEIDERHREHHARGGLQPWARRARSPPRPPARPPVRPEAKSPLAASCAASEVEHDGVRLLGGPSRSQRRGAFELALDLVVAAEVEQRSPHATPSGARADRDRRRSRAP